jgi:hypothetical protein
MILDAIAARLGDLASIAHELLDEVRRHADFSRNSLPAAELESDLVYLRDTAS